MDNRHFCVFDLKTGSQDKASCEIIHIGSCVVDRNSLKVKDSFGTLLKPEDFEAIEEEALRLNGFTREQLVEAPEASVMFPMWAKWIQKHNITKDKGALGAPIPVYWGGDMSVFDRYRVKYGAKRLLGSDVAMNVRDHMWFWTRTSPDVDNLDLVAVLEWMGVSKEEIETRRAHNTMWEVEWITKIATRLLKVGLHLTNKNDGGKRRLDMEGCFS